MTRKEKAELKTVKFCQEICEAMKGTSKLTEAARQGDVFINTQIRLRPQEKTFILNCSYKVAKKFNEIIDDVILKKSFISVNDLIEKRLQNEI